MIPVIIIIAIGFLWLLKETDYMRIRLETTGYQRANDKVKGDIQEVAPESKLPFMPSQFTPLNMPEFTGNLNIICVRE